MAERAVTLLDISVADGESGPVVVLSGEADVTTLAQLNSALEQQIWAGTRLLTVDLSELRFADSVTIGALVLAAGTLRKQCGRLELLDPQPAVARTLQLTGVDRFLTVRRQPGRCRARGDVFTGKGSSPA